MAVMSGNEFIASRLKHQKIQGKYRYLLLNFLAFYTWQMSDVPGGSVNHQITKERRNA